MNVEPRILFLTPHWPTEAAYGAQQRVLNIARILGRLGEVSFAIAPLGGSNRQPISRVGHGCGVVDVFHELPAPCGEGVGRLGQRLRYELDPRYLNTHHCTVSGADRKRLLELIEEHDLIWVHTIRMANLFGIWRWPHGVLDVDDLPSRFYSSQAQSRTNVKRRILDMRLSWIWRRRERLLTERFDVVTVCSKEDREYLGGRKRARVIPNGYNAPSARPRVASQPPRIGFIGTFEYAPNEEGVRWFITEIWPLVKREVPNAQLRLVGKESNSRLMGLGPDVVGLGWVSDPGDEIASWSAMVVPIKVGAGTRIKIAEGFARKCPVVSTTLGAFGYDVHDGEELLLADRASDFASACITLLNDCERGERLSEKAYERFLREWTWDSFEDSLKSVVEECVANRKAVPAARAVRTMSHS
jgi:polysaccharide biosynthesis protein PslH